ncbi:hypothetical protein DFR70_12628 [Nocardia tenerifensis]|uniref:Uncharacterized protein n=1 Tax=Nocardia tenerifensis TaxID=228006 RepID=A0A318JNY0_9NOCA|nr:hypothetical protein [Nocardia tenerifensis]PXX53907.1 hypothetical protein DFR70_12628 [Nocardia tenerifensis]
MGYSENTARLAEKGADTAARGHLEDRFHDLDRAIFTKPYVLIDADNLSPRRVKTLEKAYAAIESGQVETAAGTLRYGVAAADIDPEPADVTLAVACAEVLVTWCSRRKLDYVVRESGRPGGFHVITVLTSGEQVDEWSRLCGALTRRFRVPIDDRTGGVLRLLSAPHRHHYRAPVLGGTLTSETELPAIPANRTPRRGAKRQRPSGRATVRDTSRSAREFGEACALHRAGVPVDRAWRIQNRPGSKARERGEHSWRRYVWLDVVTIVAAEEGISEDGAWQRALSACRAACNKIGRASWRRRWLRAVDAAKDERPRRRRVAESVATTAASAMAAARIDATRSGLDEALAAAGDLGRRLKSCRSLLHALAAVFVTREGSVSVRDLALRAAMDVKTVRMARDLLIDRQVLSMAHSYAGGSADCHAYEPGPAATAPIEAALAKISPTSPKDTPGPPSQGRADTTLLRRRFSRERRHWRARCAALASLQPGERLASSTHPAVRAYRSLRHQLHWWRNLSPDAQVARTVRRRAALDELSKPLRSAWFDWLQRRATIAASAERIEAGSATASDYRRLERAPRTIYLGLNDPAWRVRTTQLGLAA